MQDSLPKVVNVLRTGLPTVRNKTAGHGDGIEVIEVMHHTHLT